MKLLITGGLGFIGSHTVVELCQEGHEVVIVDNLVNSKIEVLDSLEKIIGYRPKFIEADLLNYEALDEIFENHDFDGVIHFAGLKAVSESIQKPLEYYENNLVGTINLLKCMRTHRVNRIVFSSSATVYGTPDHNPIEEDAPSNQVTNPYGRTKYFIEEILKDYSIANPDMRVTILRYFNPVGAHKSGLIGEDPNGIPNNLMPIILKVANGKFNTLSIFGKDYETIDGTCVRDFIHVVDLAKGHVKAIEHIDEKPMRIVNLGTGKGTSVLELVNTFNKISGDKVPFVFADRRPGDVAENFANPSRAKEELGWEASNTIEDMCRDSWNFSQKNNK